MGLFGTHNSIYVMYRVSPLRGFKPFMVQDLLKRRYEGQSKITEI